jgi:hypothetical protein
MSIVANNISSKNIHLLENISNLHSYQIKKLKDIFSEKNNREYDQTTKQNVSISFVDGKYRFEIKKPENNMYMYQVWKKNNTNLNSDRKYKYISLREWITGFNIAKKSENFTPTTSIELDNSFYPTVMVDAKIEDDNCIFYFDSSLIVNQSDISLYQLPQNGSYNNVRFDIDSIIDMNTLLNANNVNITITLSNGTVILNGTLGLKSIDSNNNLLWQVTSVNLLQGTFIPKNTNPITYSYNNNDYTNLVQPFIASFYDNPTYTFHETVCQNFTDFTNSVTGNYNGIYQLSNQLLYINSFDNNNPITISTGIADGGTTGMGMTVGLDGNYYDQGNILNSTYTRPLASYDETSGIEITGYAVDETGKIVINNNTISNASFKFWYSSYHKAWNYTSGYLESSYIRHNVGCGPTVNEMNNNRANIYTNNCNSINVNIQNVNYVNDITSNSGDGILTNLLNAGLGL